MRKNATSGTEKKSRFSRLKSFLLRSYIRPILHTIFTLGIGGLCSAMGSWDFNTDEFFFIKLLILIPAIVFYLCIIAMYATDEKNTKDQLSIETEENRLSDQLTDLVKDGFSTIDFLSSKLQSLITSLQKNYKEANTLFKEIIKIICIDILKFLVKYGIGKEFEVLYTIIYKKKGKQVLLTIACATTEAFQPEQVKTGRTIDEHNYLDAELVRKRIQSNFILCNNDEIRKEFARKNDESSLDKYTQYCAIPVFNPERDELIGLIQISSLNGSLIGKDKEQVDEIMNLLSIPCLSILRLLYIERERLNGKRK